MNKKLAILKKPLTLRALKRRADKDGRISVNIPVSLEEVMTDIESFNDIADERVLDVNSVSGSLSDIIYTVVGHVPAMNKDGSYRKACTGGGYLRGAVIINVNADVGDIIKCEFTSEWSDGSVVTTPCIYDPKTGEVTPEVSKGRVPSGSLERELIILPDGEELDVCQVCHGFVLKNVVNPGQAKHDLVEETVCSDPNCSDEE